MNETLAKLTPHLPLDELHLEDAVATAMAVKQKLEEHLPIDEISLDGAVSTAKAVKGNLEQRYRPQPRKSKARFLIPVLLFLGITTFVAFKILRSGYNPQPAAQAPNAPADKTSDSPLAANHS